MGFLGKVLTGGALAGVITVFYSTQLKATKKQLTADLHDLSTKLTSLSPPTAPPSFPASVPARLSLSENVKARWNEKLIWGLTTVRETNYPEVLAQTWRKAKGLVQGKGQLAGEEVKP